MLVMQAKLLFLEIWVFLVCVADFSFLVTSAGLLLLSSALVA